MNHYDISDKDRQAIEKSELNEFEQRRLRGTGYDMMKHRDVGMGWVRDYSKGDRQVEIVWHVEDEKRVPIRSYATSDGGVIDQYAPYMPEDKFLIKIGKEEALIDKEAFQKLFRWV